MRSILLVLVGVALRSGQILVPVHETMHVIAVYQTGGIVTHREFDMVRFERSSSGEYVFFMGYGGELLLYGLLGLLQPAGFIATGAMACLPFIALGSYDFSQLDPWADWVFMIAWIVAVGLHVRKGIRRKEWSSLRGCFGSSLVGARNAAGPSVGMRSRSVSRECKGNITKRVSRNT